MYSPTGTKSRVSRSAERRHLRHQTKSTRYKVALRYNGLSRLGNLAGHQVCASDEGPSSVIRSKGLCRTKIRSLPQKNYENTICSVLQHVTIPYIVDPLQNSRRVRLNLNQSDDTH